MGRAWTKETSTKLGGVASSDMQFAERGRTADTPEGSYIYGRSAGSKNTLSDKSDGAV